MSNSCLARELGPEPRVAGERCELISVSVHVHINRR